MENNVSKNRSSFTTLKTILFAGFLLSSTWADAAPDTSLKKLDVKYEGIKGKNLNFKVQYHNQENNPFVLRIEDATGTILYQDKFSAKEFLKGISIDKQTHSGRIAFIIRSGKKEWKEMFTIKSDQQLVEEVSITKL